MLILPGDRPRPARDVRRGGRGVLPGVLGRWGLGYAEQRKIRPDVIYVKQSGMGAFGTYGRFRAVGPIAAALSGMSEMSGLPSPRRRPAGVLVP
jgi:crotonobetainyl-CoA:carnitine CoA-transferase CaiB-like acyl-CoA transferase